MENNYGKIVELYEKYGKKSDLLNTFYANDYPIPFKSLKIYPVKVDLFFYFQLFSQCLLVPHRTSGDAKAISMSYLKYLCYLATEKNEEEHLLFLTELLSIVFKVPHIFRNEQGETKYNIEIDIDKAEIRVLNEIIDSKDFDTLRKIILEQNDIEFPDETINPEVLRVYNEIQEFKRKHNSFKMCNFEDQINIVVAQTSYKREEVLNMTIRSFSKIFERLILINDYEIKSLLSPYMDKKDIKAIQHYLSDTSKTLKERIESETMEEKDLRKLTGKS